MIRAFIRCNVGNGVDAIGEAYEFYALPRPGDTVRVDHVEHIEEVRVFRVIHNVTTDRATSTPRHPIIIECEYLGRIDPEGAFLD